MAKKKTKSKTVATVKPFRVSEPEEPSFYEKVEALQVKSLIASDRVVEARKALNKAKSDGHVLGKEQRVEDASESLSEALTEYEEAIRVFTAARRGDV